MKTEASWKPKRFVDFGLKAFPNKFPSRTKTEIKTIDRNPYGDADKDKVMNWFDCRPLDKTKQGWKEKEYKDSSVIKIPVKRLYNLRGQYMKQRIKTVKDSEANKLAHKIEKKANKPWDEWIKGKRTEKPSGEYMSYLESEKQAYKILAEKEAKKIAKEGHRVTQVVAKRRLSRSGDYSYPIGYVKYSDPTKLHAKKVKDVMKPYNQSSEDRFPAKDAREYVRNLAKAIKSDKPEVPLIQVSPRELTHRTYFGEGRHRILAAMKAGHKIVPVEVRIDSEEDEEKMSKLKVQEAKDLMKFGLIKDEIKEDDVKKAYDEYLKNIGNRKLTKLPYSIYKEDYIKMKTHVPTKEETENLEAFSKGLKEAAKLISEKKEVAKEAREEKKEKQKVLKVQKLEEKMAKKAMKVKRVKSEEDIFEQLGIERVGEKYTPEEMAAEPKTTMTAQELIDEA